MLNKTGRPSLFKRIFVLYALIMLLAVISVQLYIADTVRERHINDLKENLLVQAALIARTVSFTPKATLDEVCKELKTESGARITIVNLDGKVLGDSDMASSMMENHGLRQEIQQAQMTGTGMAIRISDTVKRDFLYVARRITHQNKPAGYIRLSVPLHKVDEAINALKMQILAVVLFVLLVAGMFSAWQIERIRKLTGQIRDFSSKVARGEVGKKLFLGSSGEFAEIAESLNTMSVELKKNIHQIEEENDRFAAILTSIPDALLISDAKEIIRFSSAASRLFFGDIPPEGKQFVEVVRSREFLQLLDEVRHGQTAGMTELTLDHPQERYCIVRVSPLQYRGENALSGFIAIFHDITQLKKLEQVRKDFVANISHEIKTPITAIHGFAETLLEGAISDREHAERFIQTIKANSQRINSLVDDLMTISKIELGVAKVEKSPVIFDDAAEAVLAVLKDKAAQKGLYLKTAIMQNLGTIEADRDRLIQILTNLVDNAVKFTETGGVTLGASEENGRTYFFVEDTGIGIPPKHLSRLGERFYRVDAGRSRNMGGTGLGLAIVKHLVKAHGWDLQIESTPGTGTRIRIFIT